MDKKTCIAATLAGIGVGLCGVALLCSGAPDAGAVICTLGLILVLVGALPLMGVALSGARLGTRAVAELGLLLAMEIVLSRFLSFAAWNTKIGFSFFPIVIAALLYGPLPAALTAALGDFLGAILFPIGPYFPGFTLTAFLTGLTFGLFLRRGRQFWRICASVLITQFILGLLLNSFWISMLYDSPYLPLLATRVVQAAVLTAVEIPVIWAVTRNEKWLDALKKGR